MTSPGLGSRPGDFLFSGSCFAHVCLRLPEWGWSMGQDYTYVQKVPLCSFGLLCVIIYLKSMFVREVKKCLSTKKIAIFY